MKYISTRGDEKPIDFQDAVMTGLADDGGLLVPQSIPDVSSRLGQWAALPYEDLALEVMQPFITDIPRDDLRELIVRSYSREAFKPDVVATVPVGPIHILELWHGPTLAFKDVALQFLGNLFEYILKRRGGRLTILGATSGDTGSAAIHGVRGRRAIDIFMMHPHKRVSPIQERQMTTVRDGNVHNIAVRGSFDDCQGIMKELSGDLDFKRKYSIGSVNSVNWARVLAQIVYYFKAAFDVRKMTSCDKVVFSVPTGNFGDVLAGWYAMKMGAPISRLLLATNQNDILARFFNTGVYRRSQAVQTLSPSMDIQIASNFERYFFYKVGMDAARLRELMRQFGKTGELKIEQGKGGVDPDFASDAASEEEVIETIRAFHRDHDYLLDPHTAVGVCVAKKLARAGEKVICLATAHPAKFPEAVLKATGKDLAHHPDIDAMLKLPAAEIPIVPNDKRAVRELIVKTMGA